VLSARARAAAIRGVDKDGLVGDDVRQRRRARRLVAGALATVTLLALAAPDWAAQTQRYAVGTPP